VSPAAVLELELLHEIGRLRPTAAKLTAAVASSVGLRVCELPFWTVVEIGLKEKWGRDPFDRPIVANAKASGASLVTKDQKIHQHYSNAVW
jgi:PIN domain nuclease of toxin-antitoxin system